MNSSLIENIWSGTIIENEIHLEKVRELFLDNVVKQDANLEKEQSSSVSDLERIITLKQYFQWISAVDYYQKFQKSSELSIQLREKANEFYKKGEFQEAMRGYNLAITFGRFQESEVGLAYGNRAAVFMSLKKPCLAIRDISLALENKYPFELHEKLIQRRSKCENIISNNINKIIPCTNDCACAKKLKRDESLVLFQKHIFSLKSPSANVTHAEDFVQIDYDETCGRRLIVTKEIPSGTVLLVENPYVITLDQELMWDMNHCHHCYIRILGGIPCSFCTFVTYCSIDCQVNGMKGHHKYEHNLLAYLHSHKMKGKEMLTLRIITKVGPKELYQLFKSTQHQHDIKDPILSQLRGVKGNVVYESSYAEIYSLITHPECLDLREKVSNTFKALILTNLLNESSNFFKNDLNYQENNFFNFIASLLLRHLENIPYNSFSFNELQENNPSSSSSSSSSSSLSKLPYSIPYATGLLPTVSLVNHSCCPNAIHVKKSKYCKATFITVKKLFPGNEVCISYGPHFSLNNRLERRTKMDEIYKFICQCNACVGDWPTNTINIEDLMLQNKCTSSFKCTKQSKSLCHQCLDKLKNLNERYEQYENQLHEAHEYVMSGNKLDSLKAFEILKHCIDHFVEFPPTFNLSQVAQNLFKRTLLNCAQVDDF